MSNSWKKFYSTDRYWLNAFSSVVIFNLIAPLFVIASREYVNYFSLINEETINNFGPQFIFLFLIYVILLFIRNPKENGNTILNKKEKFYHVLIGAATLISFYGFIIFLITSEIEKLSISCVIALILLAISYPKGKIAIN